MKTNKFHYDYKNKSRNVSNMNSYMFAKTLSMFEYDTLPKTIPVKELERMLQTNGYVFITEHEGELYAFQGGLGGTPDVYGRPTEIIISNPALGLNKSFNLETDGVLISNDSENMGLVPLFAKYNTLMMENEISMVMAGYNNRIQKLISASDDRTMSSAERYIEKIVEGDLSVVGDNAMFEGVKVHNSASGTDTTRSMIEYHQYLKSALFNEIGLAQNFNMKRERLVSAEVDQIKDSVYPLIYDMMGCRLEGITKLNEMYGLEIKVGFGSVWNVLMKEFVDDVVVEETVEVVEDEAEVEAVTGAVAEGGDGVEVESQVEEVEEPETEVETEAEEEPEAEAEVEVEEEPETEETEEVEEESEDEEEEKDETN